MAELKTKATKASVSAFLKKVPDVRKRADCLELLKIFEATTGEKPVMWGSAIVGFGTYHYESERSAQKGDWPLTAFSPRAQNITIYIMPGFGEYQDIMKGLGTYKTGMSCLYIKKLADIDTRLLTKLIKCSVADMREKYPVPEGT